jgi:putative redox protein
VSGTNLKDSQVKRAVELSAEKYCSASIMLEAGGVDISHSYIVEEV